MDEGDVTTGCYLVVSPPCPAEYLALARSTVRADDALCLFVLSMYMIYLAGLLLELFLCSVADGVQRHVCAEIAKMTEWV